MKAALIYFTGTYNSRFLSKKVEERLVKLGYEVELFEVDSSLEVKDFSSYNLIGFSYPIYGFNCPHILMKYIKKLKFNPSQSYFIYKNSGETMKMNNASSRKIKRKMKKEDVKYLGEYHFVFPYNIHFEFPSDFIKEAIYEDKKLLDVMMYNLEHNIVHDIKSNMIYNIGAFFVSIQSIGGNVNSFFYKVDSKKCVNCSACVNMCPVNNIVNKEGKIRFKHSCVMCMRCSFYCPKKAIDIGFLQGWKVTSYYSLDKYWNEVEKRVNFIKGNEKGFYKCFIEYFKDVDKMYNSIDFKVN